MNNIVKPVEKNNRGVSCMMTYQVNINELCMSDVKPRICVEPLWIRKMPVQGQRRWLVMKYPDQYKVADIPIGALAGHKKHRGCWTVSEVKAFRTSVNIMTDLKVKVDWLRAANDAIINTRIK